MDYLIRRGKYQAVVVPLNISFKRWVENNIAGEIMDSGTFHVQLELIDDLETRFKEEGFYGAD